MALTQTDLDNLDAAIVASELEVEVDGRRVKYRSMNELLRAREHAAGVISQSAPARTRSVFQFHFTNSRGE